jgi:hypothetical protein
MKSMQRKGSGLLAIILLSLFAVGCSSQSNPTQPQASALATNATPILADTAAAEEQEPLTRLLPIPPNTSTSLVEVVKLVQAGMEESVILAYIDRCPTAFEPTVDEILYLNDLGVSAKVISALIRHGEVVPLEPGVAAAATNIVAEPMAAGEPPITATPTESAGIASQTVPQPEPQVPVAAAPPPAMPEQASVFYNDLAPYGSWMEIDGYGWCWQPTTVIVNPSWRPYGDQGRWLYTDCGWYWQSDYSWGWAPFHYGRWLRHSRCGWVWVPDTVWGPSWVSWRNTPSYCGWAPLPPSCHYVPHYGFTFDGHWVDNDCDFGLTVSLFSFIHWRHFNDHDPHGYYVPRSQTAAIYSHSKVVNNYVVGSNNTIINDGVNWDRLAAYRPTKFRPISVRELSPAAGTLLKPDRVAKNGQSLVIYRPQLQTAAPTAVTLNGPQTPDSPATRSPMLPPAGPAPAASSRNSDLVAGRTASLSDTRPVSSQPLAAPTTAGPRPTLSTPQTTPATVDGSRSSLRTLTSNPRNQTMSLRSTTQGTTIGRNLANSSRSSTSASSGGNPSPGSAPSPSTTLATPSRNATPRSGVSSYTVPRAEPRAPTTQRTTPSSTTQPSSGSSTRAPAPSWTPPAISTPAPRQPVAAPYNSPTPSYSSSASSMAPPARSAPTAYSPPPPVRSEPSSRAPVSAPSVSRSPDPTPSRTPSAPSSSGSSTSRDSSKDSGSRR